MQAEPMADMREKSLFRTDPLRKRHGLGQGEMGNVGVALQGIDYQHLASDYLLNLAAAHCLSIRNIGEITDTETQYRHHIVHHFDGHHFMAEQPERGRSYFVE